MIKSKIADFSFILLLASLVSTLFFIYGAQEQNMMIGSMIYLLSAILVLWLAFTTKPNITGFLKLRAFKIPCQLHSVT